MKAVILAAGKGTRLRPLTYGIPKPLLPIKGKPMLDWVIHSILDDSIDEVIVAVPGTTGDNLSDRVLSHVHGICIESYLKNVDHGKPVRTIPTLQRETAGDLQYVLEEAGITSGQIIVAYGDNLTSFNLKHMLDYHNRCRKFHGISATVLLMQAPLDELNRFGIAKIKQLNECTLIEEFVEKPKFDAPSNLANGGYYILEVADILPILPRTKIKMEHSVFPQLAKEHKLAGFVTHLDYWIDISTVESYENANQMAFQGLIISPSESEGKK
ncbi:MAG: NDP-sugar synthase [Candidatus Aenigmarchaeota archaeon]|nr:NDP-sugar synthase [Candidatus Aenigmarchaeota archaeon]